MTLSDVHAKVKLSDVLAAAVIFSFELKPRRNQNFVSWSYRGVSRDHFPKKQLCQTGVGGGEIEN